MKRIYFLINLYIPENRRKTARTNNMGLILQLSLKKIQPAMANTRPPRMNKKNFFF